jgi:hypothetical protein
VIPYRKSRRSPNSRCLWRLVLVAGGDSGNIELDASARVGGHPDPPAGGHEEDLMAITERDLIRKSTRRHVARTPIRRALSYVGLGGFLARRSARSVVLPAQADRGEGWRAAHGVARCSRVQPSPCWASRPGRVSRPGVRAAAGSRSPRIRTDETQSYLPSAMTPMPSLLSVRRCMMA